MTARLLISLLASIFFNMLPLVGYNQFLLKPKDISSQFADTTLKFINPHVSPDGNTLILLDRDGNWYLSEREGKSWKNPHKIEVLNNAGNTNLKRELKGSNVFICGFDGARVIFSKLDLDGGFSFTPSKSGLKTYICKLNADRTFELPIQLSWEESELYHSSNHNNPNKYFSESAKGYRSKQKVLEVYRNTDYTRKNQPDEIPKELIKDGIREVLVIGNNGILYRQWIKKREWTNFSLLSVKSGNQWSSPAKITVEGFENEGIVFESYSEITHELFFVKNRRVYSAKLPDELTRLVTLDYPNQINNPPESEIIANDQAIEVEEINKSINYGLLLAIEDYPLDALNLQHLSNPYSDATKLKKEIISNYSFDSENVTMLRNPSRSDILSSFESLASILDENDNLLVFFAGHGFYDENLEIGYWLASDAISSSKANWVSNSTIRDYISGLKNKHTLLISDACFSGSIFKTREVTNVSNTLDDYAYYRLNKLPSRKAMTSGTLNTVPDDSQFMKYLLKYLSENEKEYLPSKQLFHEIEIAIINNTANIPQFGTIQNTGDEGGDFIFVRKER